MYSISVISKEYDIVASTDEYVIWNDIAGEDDSLKMIDPELSLEVNKAGTLTFSLPPTNVGYDMIKPLITRVKVYRKGENGAKEVFWRGRVVSTENGFMNKLAVTCEGELAYLNDTIQLPAVYEDKTIAEFLELLLEVHNSYYDDYNTYFKFHLGNVSVEKHDDLKFWSTNYESTWDCIQTQLLDEYGGIIVVRWENNVRYLDYLYSYEPQREGVVYQEILFGENLTDITRYWDLASFATVVIPLGSRINRPSIENDVLYDPGDGYVYIDPEPEYKGKTTEISEEFSRNPVLVVGDNDYRTLLEIRRYKEIVKVRYIKQDPLGSQNPKMMDLQSLADEYPDIDDYINIATVNDGSVMIENPETIARYGRITKVVQFDYCDTPELVLAHGNQYMEDIQFSNMKIEIDAIDLHNFDLDVRSLNLLEYVRTISKPHKIDELLPITKLDIPLNDPASSSLSLSNDIYNPDPSFTDIVGSTVVGDGTKQKADTYVESAKRGAYVAPPILIGFHINGSETDPSNKVTYIEAAEGMIPAHMNFSTGEFDYGDWADAFFIPKPCILGHDGTVIKYLDPNDYTKDIDGNTVVIDRNLQNAEVMIEFPKVYRKIVPDANDPYSADVYFSDQHIDFGFKDWAYINKDGIHKDHFYVAAYEGSMYVTAEPQILRSVSGQQPVVYQDRRTSGAIYPLNFADAAKQNGDGWYVSTYADIELINLLLILLTKSVNFKDVYGNGVYETSNTAIHSYKNGTHTNTHGLFYGKNNSFPMKALGIENWYGLCADIFSGISTSIDHGYNVKMCYGIEDGSTIEDYRDPQNDSGVGYVFMGGNIRNDTASGKPANLEKFHFGNEIMLPFVPPTAQQNINTFTTNYCSGIISSASTTTGEAAYYGRAGSSTTAAKNGGLSFSLGNFTASMSHVAGARLTYR